MEGSELGLDEQPADDVSISGVEIRNFGPIRRCFVPVDSSFTVLYGLNGAGKSHVLDGLAEAFDLRPHLVAQRRPTGQTNRASTVCVHLTSAGWSLSYVTGRNPWDPWRALDNGAERFLRSSLIHLAQDVDVATLSHELQLEFFRERLAPLLQERYGIEGLVESVAAATSMADIPRVLTTLTRLLLAISHEENLSLWNGRTEIDLSPEMFMPLVEAHRERRLIVEKSMTGRKVFLGTSAEGEHTRSWARKIEDVLMDKIELPWQSLLRFGIQDSLRKGATGEEIHQYFERHLALTPNENIEEPSIDTSESDSTETVGSRRDKISLAAAIEGYMKNGVEANEFWDPLFDRFESLAEGLLWDSVIAGALNVPAPPTWAADIVFRHGIDPGPLPFAVLNEGTRWREFAVVRSLHDRIVDGRDPGLRLIRAAASLIALHDEPRRDPIAVEADIDLSALVNEMDYGLRVDDELTGLADTLTSLANDALQILMPGAQQLTCRVAPLWNWARSGPLEWRAVDASGTELFASELSAAELRWAEFSLRLADAVHDRQDKTQLVVLIDEPERALHRRAERHLAAGLAELSTKYDLKVIVASHSPAFLSHRPAALLHVRRDRDGETVVEPVADEFFDRADEFGLDAVDLLQMCRAVVLVEGQHELVVLEGLVGDELRELGVELLCMRGATSLKAWDAQMLERYTDVPVVVLVDNDQAERLSDVWERARAAAAGGGDFMSVLGELKSGSRGSEGEFLRELCIELIKAGDPDRYRIHAFERPDIPEYLPPSAIASRVGAKTWEDLRREAQGKAAKSTDFKDWMKRRYGADYSDESLRNAVASMDSVPEEFTRLLDVVAELIRTRR